MASNFGTPMGAAAGGWSEAEVAKYGGQTPGGAGWPPTLSGSYGHAWRQLWPNFWRLFLIGLVGVVVFYVPTGILGALGKSFGLFGLLAFVYELLVGIPLVYGAAYAVLHAARGQTPEVGDLFVPFERCYGASIGAALLTAVLTGLASILFLIPGIIVGIRLTFVPFLVVDEGYAPMAAVRESWRRTRGFSWTIFGMELLGILVSLVGVIIFVVGIIPAAMWIYLSFAALFVAVTATRGAGGGITQTV